MFRPNAAASRDADEGPLAYLVCVGRWFRALGVSLRDTNVPSRGTEGTQGRGGDGGGSFVVII